MARHEGPESTALVGALARALLDWRMASMISIAGILAVMGSMGVFSDAYETISSDTDSDDAGADEESEYTCSHDGGWTLIQETDEWEYYKCNKCPLVRSLMKK